MANIVRKMTKALNEKPAVKKEKLERKEEAKRKAQSIKDGASMPRKKKK